MLINKMNENIRALTLCKNHKAHHAFCGAKAAPLRLAVLARYRCGPLKRRFNETTYNYSILITN
jgi:hypothetical protein